jgi:Mg/Co/Ni transporter MgtE
MKEQNLLVGKIIVNEIMEIIEEIKQRVKEKNKEINLLKKQESLH